MKPNVEQLTTPRIGHAITELKGLIGRQYPNAIFAVRAGEDPEGVYLVATVDVEDMGEVVDVFLNRLVDFQVDEELPVYVLAVRPLERNLAILARQRDSLVKRSSA